MIYSIQKPLTKEEEKNVMFKMIKRRTQKIKCKKCGKVMQRNEIYWSDCKEHIRTNDDLEIAKE